MNSRRFLPPAPNAFSGSKIGSVNKTTVYFKKMYLGGIGTAPSAHEIFSATDHLFRREMKCGETVPAGGIS